MEEIPEIVQFLRGLPGFHCLDERQLGAAARAVEIEYFRQGADILTIGSKNPALHLVRSGAVELRNEDDEIMARLAEGDCFGFPSLMNDAPVRNHSVAIEDTLVYHLGGETFTRLRQLNNDFDTWFIRALSDRLLMQPATPSFRGVSGTTVRSLVGRPPVTIRHTATLRETAAKMVAERVSAMLITDKSGVCGIVTDRDIRARVVARGLDAGHPVSDIMTSPAMGVSTAVALSTHRRSSPPSPTRRSTLCRTNDTI